MRDIKFRVWDKEECKMYYSKDIKVIFDNTGENVYIPNEAKALYDYELMQYSELKDIEGNELYEGDIVSVDIIDNLFELIDGENHFIGVVKFDNGSFYIENKKKKDAILLFSELNIINKIGNIQENLGLCYNLENSKVEKHGR